MPLGLFRRSVNGRSRCSLRTFVVTGVGTTRGYSRQSTEPPFSGKGPTSGQERRRNGDGGGGSS